MRTEVFIENGYVGVPIFDRAGQSTAGLATVVSNMAYFGFAPSKGVYTALSRLTAEELADWWVAVEPVFQSITGADRKMDEHVVYQNFPGEVLAMDRAEYVFRQICIYLGVPYDWVREEGEAREPLGDLTKLKVLALADEHTGPVLFEVLVRATSRWSDRQERWADALYEDQSLDLSDFGFKENGIKLIAKNFGDGEHTIKDATDVIRLAAAMSDQDVALRTKVAFRHFKRPERRKLLAILEAAPNTDEDFAARPELTKRLLERLRPGDYKQFPNVRSAYNRLYNKEVKPFTAQIDPQELSLEAMSIAKQRPGEFVRRFHQFYSQFGDAAMAELAMVLHKLSPTQLVKLRGYLRTINDRKTLIYPPKGNWGKAQVVPNTKAKFTAESLHYLDQMIGTTLRNLLSDKFPEGIDLDPRVADVRLQTNDQKLAEYGRGTVFAIPENITFIRSASYWEEGGSTNWFDNGWNFFRDDWTSAGTVSWTDSVPEGAIFSGDPVNSNDLHGRGCQMIDLYPDQLLAAGVRYAVWNVLCFSKIKFSDATEVLATLQWGENAETGNLYEPSRAQMVFPLKSDALTSYVAYVDLKERKLVYMDAALRGRVHAAGQNSEALEQLMPAYVEYLASLPTVNDLLRDLDAGSMPVRYSDKGETITAERAFVFQPENAENTFERLTIADLLS